MTERIRQIPGERGTTTVALMRGEEELSRASIIPMVMQVGRARLRMDGIGGVATPEGHRHRGYSRRVLETAVTLMTAGDAVLSTLYGIPHFYPKYGYATLGPEYVITPAQLDERAELPERTSVRAGMLGDLPALQQLYRDETERAYGPIVRDDSWWTWSVLERFMAPGASEIRVVERGGRVVGYAARTSACWWMQQWARRESEGLKIGEAFAADAQAAAAVLAAVRTWANELGQSRVELAIPPTCRVGTAAMFQNARITERYNDQGEFMGRSTGLLSLLRALVPELEARWRPVSCSMPEFTIAIVTDGERATISGSERGIEVSAGRPADIEVRIDAGAMARLAVGSFTAGVVLERAEVSTSARAELSVLFPRHVPYIYPLDRF